MLKQEDISTLRFYWISFTRI